MLAKQAAGWNLETERIEVDLRAPTLRGLYYLRSSAKRRTREQARLLWAQTWSSNNHGQHYRTHLMPNPGKTAIELYGGLNKAQCAALIQARTGKIGLRGYLFLIKATDYRSCRRCGHSIESIEHVVLDCPDPDLQKLRTETLGRWIPWNISRLLSEARYATAIANFLLQSRLLDQFTGAISTFIS